MSRSKSPRVFSREFKLGIIRRILAGENVSALGRKLKLCARIIFMRSNGGVGLRMASRVTQAAVPAPRAPERRRTVTGNSAGYKVGDRQVGRARTR